jgi:hypothetical protein
MLLLVTTCAAAAVAWRWQTAAARWQLVPSGCQ